MRVTARSWEQKVKGHEDLGTELRSLPEMRCFYLRGRSVVNHSYQMFFSCSLCGLNRQTGSSLCVHSDIYRLRRRFISCQSRLWRISGFDATDAAATELWNQMRGNWNVMLKWCYCQTGRVKQTTAEVEKSGSKHLGAKRRRNTRCCCCGDKTVPARTQTNTDRCKMTTVRRRSSKRLRRNNNYTEAHNNHKVSALCSSQSSENTLNLIVRPCEDCTDLQIPGRAAAW